MSTGFSIEVIFVDGRTERFDFSQEQATIGSSREADLCLMLEELSPQHMLVVPREKGCWISVARGVSTPVLYGGRYLESQEVPWGAELDVGTITLRIGESVEKVRARSQSTRSMIRIGGLALIALLLIFMFRKQEIVVPRAPASAPELFEEEAAKCTSEPNDRNQRVRDLKVAATAYWQRYPFDAQEGIRAAQLFGEASDCLALLGDATQSAEMAKEQESIVEHVNKDYQALRLQLSRALKNKEHNPAKDLVRRLSNYTQHRPGKYFNWLKRVNRYLRRQTS